MSSSIHIEHNKISDQNFKFVVRVNNFAFSITVDRRKNVEVRRKFTFPPTTTRLEVKFLQSRTVLSFD